MWLAAVLGVATVACGGGGDDVSSDTTAGADETTTSEPSDPTTAATTPDTTGGGPSTIGDGTEPPHGCAEAGTINGDVDGDGQSDRVIHHMTADGPVLEVCTWYFSGRIDGTGQAEFLQLTDVDGDGTDEILFGSTSATARMVQIAHVDREGNIVVLALDDGSPLVLVDGYPDGDPPDGHRFTYGCVAATDEVPAHLVMVEVTATNADVDGGLAYSVTPLTLDFDVVTPGEVQSTDLAAVDESGTAEELMALADGVAREQAPDCTVAT